RRSFIYGGLAGFDALNSKIVAAISSLVPPPKGNVAQFARLWRFVAPYRWKIACALAALVVAASCVLALGQGLRHVIDAGFGSRDPHLLNTALAAVVGV